MLRLEIDARTHTVIKWDDSSVLLDNGMRLSIKVLNSGIRRGVISYVTKTHANSTAPTETQVAPQAVRG